jgi:O-antigen ligase
LIASALLHPSKSVRTRLLSGVAVLGALIVIGLVLRHERAWVFARYIIEKTPLIASSLGRPSCGLAINLDNSIAIREALLRDAIYLLPDSGLFGLGLDGYMVGSCLPNTQAHNVVVQAVVEFGFVGGGLFVGLIIACLLFPLAQASRNPQARFVFCCGVFYLAESCFHGRISRDIELFAFLGVAARFSDGPLRVKLRQRAAATAG